MTLTVPCDFPVALGERRELEFEVIVLHLGPVPYLDNGTAAAPDEASTVRAPPRRIVRSWAQSRRQLQGLTGGLAVRITDSHFHLFAKQASV